LFNPRFLIHCYNNFGNDAQFFKGKMMQPITLTLDLVNQILGYLGSKTYAEVYQIVAEINKQALPQVTPVEADASAETPAA
jgi:hypothetical protein